MAEEKIKYWNSIVARFGLFFTVLILVCVLSLGYLIFKKSSQTITDKSQQEITHTVKMATRAFHALRDEVANDIAFLSQNPVLSQYVYSPTAANKEQLQAMFGDFLKRKPHYFQIRLIGNDQNGTEIIRLNKNKNTVSAVPEAELQTKGDKDYFQNTINLGFGQYYFSPINLNEEFGEISKPYIPTFRAASVVQNKAHQTLGIVVINVDLNAFYSELIRMRQPGMELYIVDSNGQFLFASDVSICFGEQLSHNTSFSNIFNGNLNLLTSVGEIFLPIEDKSKTKHLSYSTPLELFGFHTNMFMIGMMEEQLVLKDVKNVQLESLRLTLIIGFFALLLALLFTTWLSRRISKVTQIISAYDQGESLNMPTKMLLQNDEIGLLARVFRNMKQRIDSQFSLMQDALEKKKEAIQDKDQFLQNMSHELRTPLNTILGLTQLLQKKHLNEGNKSIISALQRSANNLSGLMHDILDHKKLQAGIIRLEHKNTNLHQLIDDIYTTYQYDAIQKGLAFNLDLEGIKKDQEYTTDPLRLEQILSNLIVNAIKYTQRGIITISGKVEKEQTLLLTISDTGTGLSDAHTKFLEGKIDQLELNENLGSDSYGLGLMVIQQLVTLLNGQIAVATASQGSNISISLPITKAAQTHSIPSKNQRTLPILKNRYTIYHLEDDPITQQLVGHILDGDSWQLQQTTSLETLSEWIEKGATPQLILSDLMLNQQYIGSDITNSLFGSTPILLTSALEPAQMKNLSDYFIQKPFDMELFLEMVLSIVGRAEYETPQMETMYALYDHQPERVLKYLNLLKKEFSLFIERINKAYQDQDQEEWEAICHKMIASIKALALNDTQQLLTKQIIELNEPNKDRLIHQLSYCLCFIHTDIYLKEAITDA